MGYIGSDPKTNESVSTAQLVDDSVTNAKIVDNVLFTSVTSSVVSASGTITADTFTGTFSGALSSSAQIATSISGSSTSLSSSLATRTTTLESASGSFSTRVTTIEGSGTAQGVGTSDSPTFNNITATGTVTAQEFHSEFVSASITFTSGSHKFGDSADDIQQMTGSLRITGSGDHYIQTGNVGIGTNNPSSLLDVFDSNGVGLRFGDVSSTPATPGLTAGLIGMSTSAYSGNNGDLVLMPRTSATSKILLMEGNVGIGVTTPSSHLVVSSSTKTDVLVGGNSSVFSDTGRSNVEINGQSTATLSMTIGGAAKGLLYHDGTNSYFRNYANGYFAIYTNNGEKVRIDNSGNVGIGTNNPTTKVDIASTSFGLPATSGTTPAGMFRIGYNDRSWGGNENMMGIINSGTNGYAFYMQTKVPTNYALHRPTFLNPQGGYVAINSLSGSSGGFASGVPAQPLHVHGKGGDPVTSGTYTDSTVGSIRLSGNSGQYCVLDMGINDSNDYAWLQAYRANSLHVEDDIILNPNGGNVGVGVKGSGYPASTLHLGADPTVELRFEDTGQPAVMLQIISAEYTGTSPYNNNRFIALNSSNITFEAGSSERMRITSGGNVGIGHTTPQYGLTMAQGTADGQKIGWEDGSNNKRGAILVNSSNDDMEFMTGTSDAVRMRITDNGKTQWGTYTGNGSTEGVSLEPYGNGYLYASECDVTSAQYHLYFLNGNGNVGRIETTSSQTNYVTSSDYRLKTNQVLIKDGLLRLNKLKPYEFNFKTDLDTKIDGFFAHEVQEILPYAVSGEKDAVDENGEMIVQGLDNSKLVPLLVAAVQELSAKVEALES